MAWQSDQMDLLVKWFVYYSTMQHLALNTGHLHCFMQLILKTKCRSLPQNKSHTRPTLAGTSVPNIFGFLDAHFIILNPAQCCAKLDKNTTTGIFLGFTATDKNVHYQDSITKHFKTTTHCVFDEAGMVVLAAALTPSQIALQELGYHQLYANADYQIAQHNEPQE
jgi:hypothetical protein